MIEVSEKTIALKTPIKSCGDESAKCSGSSRLDPRSVFSTSIPPSTTPSTINDISSLGRPFGSSEPKQPPDGKMRLLSHETRSDLADSLHHASYRDNAARVWIGGPLGEQTYSRSDEMTSAAPSPHFLTNVNHVTHSSCRCGAHLINQDKS
jgi:hypothetical protein